MTQSTSTTQAPTGLQAEIEKVQMDGDGAYSYVLSAAEMAAIERVLINKVTQEECDLIEHVLRQAKVKWYEPATAASLNLNPTQGSGST